MRPETIIESEEENDAPYTTFNGSPSSSWGHVPDGADAAKKKTDLDAIQAKYQPEVDAFVDAVQAFADKEIAAAPADKKAQMQAELDQGLPQMRNLPAMMRAQFEGAAAAPAAAPAPAPVQ